MTRQEIVKELEVVKSLLEWEHPLDLCVAIDKAIEDVELVDKAINSYGEVAGGAYIQGVHDGANAEIKKLFNKLCECPLFMGHYDAEHGNEHYMYGISTVMEFIAHYISDEVLDEFSEKFLDNMLKSESKCAKKEV